MAHMVSSTSWVLPVNMIRSGDRVQIGDDQFPRSLVVESSRVWTHDGSEKWEIKTQKHEEDWDWSTYDTYGKQLNDDYDGPEYIWPEDCLDQYVFDSWDVELEMANDTPQLLDPETYLPFRWWVSVYELDQGYGGPEEGGWWFTTGEIQMNVPCRSYEQAEEVQEMLRMKYGENDGDYPYGSVLYRGGSYQVSIHKSMGRSFPERAPRYS